MVKSSSLQMQGLSAMTLAMVFLPLMDAIAKWLSVVDKLPPATITLFRFAVPTILTVLIIMLITKPRPFHSANVYGNLCRGVLLGIASLCFHVALKYMPLADATAIFFAEPLILTLLSAIALKEQVGWYRWSAVAIGFTGTLIVIQPTWSSFGWVSLLPLASAALFAAYLSLNRYYGTKDTQLIMQLYAGLGGTITVLLAMIPSAFLDLDDMAFSLPDRAISWFWLLTIGGLAMIGHLLIIQASALAPASLIAPFQYLEIVMAVFIGLLIFNDFPSISKWTGITVIVGASATLIWGEGRSSVKSKRSFENDNR